MAMRPLEFLREVFPNKSDEQINTIICIVEEQNPLDSPDQKMENMYNMLAGDAFNNEPQENQQSNLLNIQENNFRLLIEDDDFEEEGAVGYGHNNTILNNYFEQLQNLFPSASDDYLWEFCSKRSSNFDFDEAIEELTRDGYERKVVDSSIVWNRLKEALPLADPSYLEKKAEELVLKEPEELEEFVSLAVENNDFPTMEEYLKRKQEEDALNIYKQDHNITAFIQMFIKIFPDPEKHFNDPNHQNPLQQANLPQEDLLYAKTFLYNKYPYIRKRHVDLVFRIRKGCLLECCNHLDSLMKGMRIGRPVITIMPDCKNLALLQEVAYLKYRKLIRRHIKHKDEVYQECKEQARALGLLETCGICTEDELIPEECFTCKKGCIFCKECINKYVEVRMGDGQTNFPCCNDCNSTFNLHTLQMVLSQHTFERLVLKIQSDEIKQANVDGVETCSFCDFAAIPPEDSKIFKCENPECLKESCRLCKHVSHIPLRCNEIEYDEDVRRRTYIENMMTEALARTCNKCNKKFIKSNGCNKMICNCGAIMCYLCSQTITGYDHFGTNKACQLFTNDAQIDLGRVREGAEKAKRELGNVEIKFDPTVGIENFFPAS